MSILTSFYLNRDAKLVILPIVAKFITFFCLFMPANVGLQAIFSQNPAL